MSDSSITPLVANLAFPFQTVYATINAIVNALATEIVTANGSAAGATTIGNGNVIGTFGATTLVTSHLRGGNTSTPNTLPIDANVSVNSSSYIFLGNTSVNSTTVQTNVFIGTFLSPFQIGNTFIYDLNFSTVGTTPQIVDSFTFITYRSAEYFIQVKDNNANNYMYTRINVLQDGGSAYYSEYATLTSNTANMGVFVANANTSAVTLYFTPVSTSTTLKMTRISLTI